MATLGETRVARDNLATEDDLIQRMNSIESQALAWMGAAAALHGAVDAADRAKVLAMRDLLISKLTAAVAV